MPLIHCAHCGREIFDDAAVCQYCGMPLDFKEETALTIVEEASFTEELSENDYVVLLEGFAMDKRKEVETALMEVCGLHREDASDTLLHCPVYLVRGVNKTVAMTIARSLNGHGANCNVYFNDQLVPLENLNNQKYSYEQVPRSNPYLTKQADPAYGGSIYNAYSGRLRPTGRRMEGQSSLKKRK